jgi:hypothetical protein
VQCGRHESEAQLQGVRRTGGRAWLTALEARDVRSELVTHTVTLVASEIISNQDVGACCSACNERQNSPRRRPDDGGWQLQRSQADADGGGLPCAPS